MQLKASLHEAIDSIENQELLQTLYDFLKARDSSEDGELWSRLSEQEKSILMTSYEESEDPSGLTSNSDVFEQ